MPSSWTLPDYRGGSVVNLVAEVEARLGGRPPMPRLHPGTAAAIPASSSFVLVLFDGLGAAQLEHPAASDLARSRAGTLDTVFPTTTTVALASIATGLPPSRHGLLGYQLWLPEVGEVVNTIKWTTLWGSPLPVETAGFLPAPNLWERLRRVGVEPVTVQPAGFEGSPLSAALYRDCRFESALDVDELVAATVDLAEVPGRLVVAYLPHVDVAAHVHGQSSPEYAEALRVVSLAWSRLVRLLGGRVAIVGTSDHGHVDVPASRRVRLPTAAHEGRILYGDSRVMFVLGPPIETDGLPATWRPFDRLRDAWGPPPASPAFEERRPDGALVADDGHAILHRHSDVRLVGHHGGLTDAERLVPLLVG